MEHENSLPWLFGFLEKEGVVLSSEQKTKLQIYLNLLLSFSEKHRLVSTSDVRVLVEKHFLGSFWFVKEILQGCPRNSKIIDIGSGGGFPAIILAIMFEKNHITLVESVRKKALFLKKVLKEIGSSAIVVNERIEVLCRNTRLEADVVTARALASIDTLLGYVLPFIGEGELHTIKGRDWREEYSGRINTRFSSLSYGEVWNNRSEYLNNKVYVKVKLQNEE